MGGSGLRVVCDGDVWWWCVMGGGGVEGCGGGVAVGGWRVAGGGVGWRVVVVVVPSPFHAPPSNTRYDRITLCVCVCVCVGKGIVSFCHATRNSPHSDHTFSSLTHHTLITHSHYTL